jgi:hypothetical protein
MGTCDDNGEPAHNGQEESHGAEQTALTAESRGSPTARRQADSDTSNQNEMWDG